MGYTHYWSHAPNLDRQKLLAAMQDAAKIVDTARAQGIALEVEFGEPTLTLNGVDEDSHEPFIFPQNIDSYALSHPKANGYLWAFCKTARKPYDVVVCAILLVLKHHLGKQIMVASDGGREDDEWIPAEKLVQEVLGYEVRFEDEETLEVASDSPN